MVSEHEINVVYWMSQTWAGLGWGRGIVTTYASGGGRVGAAGALLNGGGGSGGSGYVIVDD